MKNLYLYKAFLAIVLGVFSLQAHSIAISANDCTIGSGTGTYDEQANTTTGYNCWLNPAKGDLGYINNPKVSDFSTITGLTSPADFRELYKMEADPLLESGGLWDSYNTTFTDGDGTKGQLLSGAIINNDGPYSASCPNCYLLVKDGNQAPTWYLFDLGYWDGIENIILSDFWLGKGAISHVSIWGVPEPGMVGLLAIGLLGMVVVRRKPRIKL